MEAIGKVFFYRECNRDRPENAAGQLHMQARTAPVVMPHKAIERGIGPHCQHEEVGDCARVERNFPEFLRPLKFFGSLRLQQQWLDLLRAVRWYELRHCDPS